MKVDSLLPRRKLLRTMMIAVGIGLFVWLFFAIVGPTESVGPPPSVILSSLSFEQATSINKVVYSPSGRLILIEGDTNRGQGGNASAQGLVVIVDPQKRKEVARIRGVSHVSWADNDVLWGWMDKKWVTFSTPFDSYVATPDDDRAAFPDVFDSWAWDQNIRTRRLAVAEPVEDTDDWIITITKMGGGGFDVRVTPQYANGSQRFPSLRFSPNGEWLAVVFSGWIGYESPGPEEFWLIDVKTQSVRHIRNGKIKWWQIFDCETERLSPSWSASGDVVVFGDYNYGIKEMSIPNGYVKTILPEGSGTIDVALSGTGKWVSFSRWPGHKDDAYRCDRCFGVVSRDGWQVFHLPRTFINWPFMWSDWHPNKDELAVLKRNGDQDTFDLLLWNLGQGTTTNSDE